MCCQSGQNISALHVSYTQTLCPDCLLCGLQGKERDVPQQLVLGTDPMLLKALLGLAVPGAGEIVH